ncbi:MAG: ATP-binding protein [Planctomycetota bacterium]
MAAHAGFLRSPFFWKLSAAFGAVALLTGVLVGWLVEGRLEASLLADLERKLQADCGILLPRAGEDLLSPESGRLAAEFTRMGAAGVRLTLIGADGQVRADSHEEPARMDDHSNRPEIVAARAAGLGVARRRSHTLGREMLFVAVPVDGENGPLGFVRASLPVEEIDASLAAVRRSVLVGTTFGVLVAFAGGLLLARRITRPLAALTEVAGDLTAGRYDSRVAVTGDDELGLLGATLNRLGEEVTRRIAALSQEDAQLRAMLASMIEGVVAIDENDRIAFINQAARALLDADGGEARGRSLWELAPVRELADLIARARSSGGHVEDELDLFRGARERILQVHVSPFQGGEAGGIVLVLHDISELRRLERVRRDFVANVSHELKTPLTSIQGFVETLLSGALHDQENNVRFLQRIEVNVRRLTSLVSDLLSLAKIESGQLAIERGPVDWREVLEGVLRLREPALTKKGLTLEVLGRKRAVLVRGDREAMTQVLDNLLDNAIQYTNAPGRVVVRFWSEKDRGFVSVADSGIGIPAADLERVFERFYRVDKARSRAVGGTGLGLSIVKNLVLRMEGEVRVESVEGKGSTFTVELPAA